MAEGLGQIVMQLAPEEQLISNIMALSLRPSDSHIEWKILPVGQINWDRFIPLVNHHRLGGVLFYWVKELKIENILPRDVYKALKNISEHLTRTCEDYQRILKRILMGFNERGMEIILVKGSQLAHIDYPFFALRPMEDIDLLVRQSDWLEVIRLMPEMGFSLYHTSQTCNKFFIRQTSKGRKRMAQKTIFIEVHSNFQPPLRLNRSFSPDMDEFWSRTQKKAIAELPFLQLCPTHNLVYLCVHLSEHYFSRLIWIYDIALLVFRHREEIDWEKLEDFCERMKIRSPVYHGLSLCQELFQIPIPEKVLKSLSPSWWKRKMGQFLIRRSLRCLEKCRVSRFSQFLTKMFLVDSWIDAMLWFLFPTREWMRQQYSLRFSYEIYPYYLLHPLFYLIKCARTSVK